MWPLMDPNGTKPWTGVEGLSHTCRGAEDIRPPSPASPVASTGPGRGPSVSSSGSTVQKLFPGEGMEATRADVEPPPRNPPLGQIRLMAADYDDIKREAKTLKARFNEISH